MDNLCYLCLVFVMLLHLFIAALRSPAQKGLTSWLLFVMFNCIFVTFPCGILGQVWYLIVSIPDLCRLSYFSKPTWHRSNESMTRMTPPGVLDETLSNHLGNSSTSLTGSQVRVGGALTCCIN